MPFFKKNKIKSDIHFEFHKIIAKLLQSDVNFVLFLSSNPSEVIKLLHSGQYISSWLDHIFHDFLLCHQDFHAFFVTIIVNLHTAHYERA